MVNFSVTATDPYPKNTRFVSAKRSKGVRGALIDFQMDITLILDFTLIAQITVDKGGINSNITTQEVEAEIARLGTLKTPGPDLIHPIFLKNGGYQVRKTLAINLNTLFLMGKVPFLWHVANITPIPKKPGSDISFFRPISVLSVPGKLLDSIVAQRISYTAEINNWLKPFPGWIPAWPQHNFRTAPPQAVRLTHFPIA